MEWHGDGKHTVQYDFEGEEDGDDDEEEDLVDSVSVEPVLCDYLAGDVRIL
jgi:hypothetical protein